MAALLALDRATPYRELRDPPLPDALRALALELFAAERRIASEHTAVAGVSRSTAGAAVSAADGEAVSVPALDRLLASGASVGGVVTQREVATAIPFNARHTRDAIHSGAIAARRRRLDAALARWVRGLFADHEDAVLHPAGQWWYPPGTWFGWHTNHAYPGWRLYLSHAEDPGRSFFRYRDPRDGAIVTSLDGGWDLRLFEVSSERVLWHAIASDTHRFSVGWVVRPWSLRDATRLFLTRALRR